MGLAQGRNNVGYSYLPSNGDPSSKTLRVPYYMSYVLSLAVP
jgi:hypothetical protein